MYSNVLRHGPMHWRGGVKWIEVDQRWTMVDIFRRLQSMLHTVTRFHLLHWVLFICVQHHHCPLNYHLVFSFPLYVCMYRSFIFKLLRYHNASFSVIPFTTPTTSAVTSSSLVLCTHCFRLFTATS